MHSWQLMQVLVCNCWCCGRVLLTHAHDVCNTVRLVGAPCVLLLLQRARTCTWVTRVCSRCLAAHTPPSSWTGECATVQCSSHTSFRVHEAQLIPLAPCMLCKQVLVSTVAHAPSRQAVTGKHHRCCAGRCLHLSCCLGYCSQHNRGPHHHAPAGRGGRHAAAA